ncbi:MAG: DMT family transporter [Acetivibrionales bacterium]
MFANEKVKIKIKALSALIIAAVLWSTSGLFVKLISWNPVAIAGARSLVSVIFLFALKRRRFRFNRSLAQLGGAVSYAAVMIFFVVANKMTTSANAILLQYTAPIYVAVFGAWFLKEKTSLRDWVTVCFVLTGMVLFFVDELSPGRLLGNIFAAASGAAFACTTLFMRVQKDSSTLESLLLGNIITALAGLPFYFQSVPGLKSILFIIIAGILQVSLAYLLYGFALRYVTALEGVLVTMLEPILNPIWVLVFVGETPGIMALLGGAIVLTSVTACSVLNVIRPVNKEKN